MKELRTHVYTPDTESHRQVCVCGKSILDPVHTPNVKVVRGIAKPVKLG